MNDNYGEFLAGKRISSHPVGFEVGEQETNPSLFDFQKDVVRWAVRRGRAALLMDCGTGKTIIQLDWARLIHQHTGGNILILAPLAVAAQTAREGEKFGIPVTVCREAADVQSGINITNYERLHRFDPSAFVGIVLDESSILKGFDGKTRKLIGEFAAGIHYRLACTATPAPNDLIELTNHAEFLNIMSGKEIIALFFTQDGNTTHKWRLKGHAREDFWRWMASWSVAVRKPSDLGYEDGPFVLPDLRMIPHVVPSKVTTGTLFAVDALTLQERQQARRDSIAERVRMCKEVIEQSWANQVLNTGALTTPPTGRSASRISATPTTGITKNEKPQTKPDGSQATENSNASITVSTTVPTSIDIESGIADSSCADTDSPKTRSSQCSNLSTAVVQSADRSQSQESISTSTTITQPDLSEDCCATPAISCSDDTTTIKTDSSRPAIDHRPNTSNVTPEPWVIWVDLNEEQRQLERAFGDRAISIYGSLPADEKERRLLAWLDGERPVLITKPSIAGFGVNLQHCAMMAFVGLSDSYEQQYQAIRRCWRFGQDRAVEVHVITAEAEGAVVRNIERKEEQAAGMMANIVRHMHHELSAAASEREEMAYDDVRVMHIPEWLMETKHAA